MTEKQLINNCIKGIRSSQYLLVQRYSAMLLAVCKRYTRDEAMAQDVLQETLIRVFQYIGRYREGNFEAWMRRIAIRRSLQWVEKSSFKHELHPVRMPDIITTEPLIYTKLDFEDLLQLINTLPISFRTVFNLYVVENYSHKEIAELLGIPENTSRSQLIRARRILQKALASKKTYEHELERARK